MSVATLLRQRSRALLLVTGVPLALAAAVVDGVRVRCRLEAARRDPLTGLPGRDGLAAYATKSLASGHRTQQLLLVMCDGNGFKAINDGFGHAAGDQVVSPSPTAFGSGPPPTEASPHAWEATNSSPSYTSPATRPAVS
ncbi:GGDEF domain-containing protein [Streptomyces sp. NPDC058864]